MGNYSIRRALAASALILLLAVSAYADVTVGLGQGQGWAGGLAQTQVSLQGSPAPAVLEIRFLFDSNKLDLIGVQPGPVVTSANKSLSWEESPPGRGKIVIVGVNTQTMSNGVLASLQFAIKSAAQAGNVITLDGDSMSASGAAGETQATVLNDGQVTVVTCSQPATPTGLTATDGAHPDRVHLAWAPVASTSEYVIYRSTSSNAQTATAIATVTATEYDDRSADAPAAAAGCSPGGVKTYSYWVAAKAPCGESPFSASDTGFRGFAKLAVQGAAKAMTMPPPGLAVATGSTAAVRLTARDPIDPATLWGQLDGRAYPAEWVPVNERDGWALCRLDGSIAAGATFIWSAGARSIRGELVGPFSAAFPVSDGGDASDALLSDVPPLATGVGPIHVVGPMQVYDLPYVIDISIPDGSEPSEVQLFYYLQNDTGSAWYPAEDVEGWLASPIQPVTGEDGRVVLRAAVHHGGFVQVGVGHGEVHAAGLSGGVDVAGFSGSILVIVLLSLACLACRFFLAGKA
ncbi:MAG: hypothetical protein AMXMBFR84_11540 [Candidatus Hydrogenedentota bacterium]